MKKNKSNLKVMATAALIIFVITAGYNFPQNNSISDITANKHALKNLISGIKSENLGLKRSAVYFAGKYKIAETESTLISQLKEEKDPGTRILLAIVLYEMGSENGLNEVKKLSTNDDDAKVRRMATQIYHEYLINDSDDTAMLSR